MQCESFGCRGSQDKIGVLIAQLGTPDAPTPAALRKYLREFLLDPRVIEVPRILWWLILHCIILVFRPKRSARLYSRIWTAEGSPLLVITRAQTEKVRSALQKIHPSIEVTFGMRYGSYSLSDGLEDLIKKGCSKILLFPMYPQYSAPTTASIYDDVFKILLNRRCVPTLKVAEPYFAHPSYVKALATVINETIGKIPEEKKPERLVLSYHGIPNKYVEKGDVYCCHCTETTEALLPLLDISRDKVIHTYQSRFGKEPWLIPYTDRTIEALPEEGITRIAVAAPGFTADCLETLDELGNEGAELYHESGGKEFYCVPCLNDHSVWIEAMTGIIVEELGAWIPRAQRFCSGGDHKGVQCPVREARARGIVA